MTRRLEVSADLCANADPVSRRRRNRYVSLLMIFLITTLFGVFALRSWQTSALGEAVSLVESRKYREALPVLTKLQRFSLMKDDQRSYLLGLCQEKTGRRDLAIESWDNLKPGTRFFDDVTLKIAEWFEDEGKLADAEARYRNALSADGPMKIELRHGLMQLYWLEGRFDEARYLLRRNLIDNERKLGPNDSRTIAVLRALLTLDLEVYPIEHVRKRVEAAASKSPEDLGVALARAYLAMRSGQSEEARSILAKLDETSPSDTRIGYARFLESLERGEADVVATSSRNFPIDLPPPGVSARAAALVAGSHGSMEQAIRILESCLEKNPGEIAVIERLAEAYVATGQREKAATLRSKRLTLDHDRREYAILVNADFLKEASRMADLAERLGRYFEAAAFLRMSLGKDPGNQGLVERIRHLSGLDEAARQNGHYWEMIDSARSEKRIADSGAASVSSEARIEPPPAPKFRDIAKSAGMNFVFESGRSDKKQLPETMSGGVAILDYDKDGWNDIFVVQGGSFPFDASAASDLPGDRLYRNLGNGSFDDVTEKVGLPPRRIGYGHGVTVGDIDNDGFPDLFVARYGSYVLYRNVDGTKFEDVTTAWGLNGDRDWPSSAGFADLDNDGDLDLYVCHYVVWDSSNPRLCGVESGGSPAYCVPHLLTARPDRLYRNDGSKFVDVSEASGITAADKEGRGLGVVAADFDADGLVDLFVANDGTANFLFRNLGGMKFEEIGLVAGVAANSDGGYQAGMGIGFGDFDADGRFDLSVTNFYGESTSLFQNLGDMIFRERGAGIGLKEATRYRLGFGTVMGDFNCDGYLDQFTANGHVNDVRPVIPYEMPCQLILGTKTGRVFDSTDRSGPELNVPRLGRGLAVGDLDNDGRLDLVQLSLDSALVVLLNDATTDPENERFVGFRLIGSKSNRDAVGARVSVRSGDFVRHGYRYGGGSYQSANSQVLHFGLGKMERIDEVVVNWPSGQVDRHANLAPGRYYLLKEGATPAEPVVPKAAVTGNEAARAQPADKEGIDR